MPRNPISRRIKEVREQIESVRQRQRELQQRLQWYKSFTPDKHLEEIQRLQQVLDEAQRLEREIEQRSYRLEQLRNRIPSVRTQIDGLEDHWRHLSEDLAWYSAFDEGACLAEIRQLQTRLGQAIELQREIAEQRQILEQLGNEIATIRGQAETLGNRETELSQLLAWYNSFDAAQCEAELRQHHDFMKQLRELEEQIAQLRCRADALSNQVGTLLNPFNWFDRQQRELRAKLREVQRQIAQRMAIWNSMGTKRDKVQARITALSQELDRFRNFDVQATQQELATTREQLQKHREELSRLEERQRIVREELEDRLSKLAQLNPADAQRRIAILSQELERYRNFDAPVKQQELRTAQEQLQKYREELTQLEHLYKAETGELEALLGKKAGLRVEEARSQLETLSRELRDYRDFNIEDHERELASVEEQMQRLEKKLKNLEHWEKRAQDKLSPLQEECEVLQGKKLQAENDLQRARRLEHQLKLAEKPRERFRIHQRCEREFGDGSPARVAGKLSREIERLERDLKKLEERMERLCRRYDRIAQVEHVIVDGNNCCYDGDGFIGLAALKALIPVLTQSPYGYRVSVIFDGSICPRLGVAPGVVEDRLLNGIIVDIVPTVHIVPSRQSADETILGLAEDDPHAYVLSRDRFGDYPDRRAVREDRLIPFELLNGQLFIHELELHLQYRQD